MLLSHNLNTQRRFMQIMPRKILIKDKSIFCQSIDNNRSSTCQLFLSCYTQISSSKAPPLLLQLTPPLYWDHGRAKKMQALQLYLYLPTFLIPAQALQLKHSSLLGIKNSALNLQLQLSSSLSLALALQPSSSSSLALAVQLQSSLVLQYQLSSSRSTALQLQRSSPLALQLSSSLALQLLKLALLVLALSYLRIQL